MDYMVNAKFRGDPEAKRILQLVEDAFGARDQTWEVIGDGLDCRTGVSDLDLGFPSAAVAEKARELLRASGVTARGPRYIGVQETD